MNNFRVLFAGKLKEGFQEDVIKDIFTKRFNIRDSGEVEKIFSGRRIEIRGGLDGEEAARLLGMLTEMGLEVEIDPPLEGIAKGRGNEEDPSLATVFEKLPNSEEEAEVDETLATAFNKLPDSESENPEDETLATVFDRLPDAEKDETLATAFNKLPDSSEEGEAQTGENEQAEEVSKLSGETQSLRSDAVAVAAAFAENEEPETISTARISRSQQIMLGVASLVVIAVLLGLVVLAVMA
jgi:hypothetical protein